MARQLILFRHGKSDWGAGCDLDHQRPLAKRGIKAAKVMGKLLAAIGQVPDAVLTSSALRARSTVELAAQAGRWTCPIRITDSLYDAEPKQVLSEIQLEPDETQTLLLTGHEPTWSILTTLLIGGGQICFPTAALARIDFEVNAWQQVAYGQGYLIWLLQPKLFLDRKI